MRNELTDLLPHLPHPLDNSTFIISKPPADHVAILPENGSERPEGFLHFFHLSFLPPPECGVCQSPRECLEAIVRRVDNLLPFVFPALLLAGDYSRSGHVDVTG